MDPNFRKVALAAATLGLLVSLYFALRPGASDEGAPSPVTTAATSAGPAPTTATTVPAAPGPVTIRIVAEGGLPVGGIRRASVKEGRRVVIRVESDLTDEIHLHGYDLSAPVGRGTPAQVEFTADVTGRFELELEQRGIPLAELEVRP